MSFFNFVHPYDYYFFELFRLPRKWRLNFVFNHEATSLNHVLSGKISKESLRLLSSKNYFSDRAKTLDLPSIESIQVVNPESEFVHEMIFREKSLFVKPDQSSRSKGCFSITYCTKKGYLLEEMNTNIRASDEETIVELLRSKLCRRTFLIQELYRDHDYLSFISLSDRLTTFRIVSHCQKNDTLILSALLEVAINIGSLNNFIVIQVDPKTGVIGKRIVGSNLVDYKKYNHYIENIGGKTIPLWDEVKTIVKKTHSMCSDISTVGWDIAITTKGIKILEGNFTWGCANHQWGLMDNNGARENPFLKIL